jgi:putative addiction module killer protein
VKEIHFYKTPDNKVPFGDWYSDLDNSLRITVDKRLNKVSRGIYGFFKQISPELYELKFNNGLRIYYTETDKYIVILFNGGNKQKQSNDIKKAKEYLKEYKEQRNDKKAN